MNLLDIIIEPRRIPHRLPDTLGIPKPLIPDTASLPKPALPDSIPADSTDSFANIMDSFRGDMQLADVAPPPLNMLESDNSQLWTILAVIVALGLCFFCVRMYRRQH